MHRRNAILMVGLLYGPGSQADRYATVREAASQLSRPQPARRARRARWRRARSCPKPNVTFIVFSVNRSQITEDLPHTSGSTPQAARQRGRELRQRRGPGPVPTELLV